MTARLTVLSAQARPVAWDPDATLRKFEHDVRMFRRAYPHVDLYLYPEVYLSGEDPWTGGAPKDFERRAAEPIPGPRTERIGKLAARVRRWICAGSVLERDGDDLYNTALVFSPTGRLVVRYRKVFPWTPHETVTRGTEPPSVFSIPRVGKLGVLICYDGSFPEMARGLALRGAEVILHPTLTTTADRELEMVMARANAFANQCYVLNVNAAVSVGGGRSIGVDPHGRVLFELGQTEEFAIETLDLDMVREARRHGSHGMSRLLEHIRSAPPSALEPLRPLLRRR
jgi:formamidase